MATDTPAPPQQNGQMQVQAADVLARIEKISPDVFHRAVAEVQSAVLQKQLQQVNEVLLAQQADIEKGDD